MRHAKKLLLLGILLLGGCTWVTVRQVSRQSVPQPDGTVFQTVCDRKVSTSTLAWMVWGNIQDGPCRTRHLKAAS